MKNLLKSTLHAIFLALAFPFAALSGFGRIAPVFHFFGQSFSLTPGFPGDYLRMAFYRLTLERYELDSRIQFGSFFAHSSARVGHEVYIGPYCVLGRTSIGDRTQIAAGVQILSGRRQHPRDNEGRIQTSESGNFETIAIGAHCWIGAGAIVMAEVGEGTTIGAGSVVVKPIPAKAVAMGNPARVASVAGQPVARAE